MSRNPGFDSVRASFQGLFGEVSRMYRAPGRINLIGEHTDYNDGFVLPSTVDLYTWAAVSERADRLLRIHLCHEDETYDIDLDRIERGEPGQAVEYLKGVAWALMEAGYALAGRNIVIDGNIPIGGGLSSSASLELLLCFALTGSDHDDESLVRLSRASQRAESEFAGCACGIMDQFAVALGQKGFAMRLDCRSLDYDLHPLPADAAFLVVHSGVAHQLPAGEYNSRRDECTKAVKRLSKNLPELCSLRDLDMSRLEQNRGLLDDLLFRRCRHVLTENARVGQAVAAMDRGDMLELGDLISQSHDSLRDDYEVSCEALDRLVEIALGTKGVLGSRMMGGGFGGCTISLVEHGRIATAARSIAEHYGAVLGRTPWMHVVQPTGPVCELEQ